MKAAIYIRVSTLDQAQEGYSLAAQRKTLESHAKTHGMEVYQVYEDAGISAKTITKRPALQCLLDDAAHEKFDVVLVWALSRFTRSVLDLYKMWELLEGHNVSLMSYTETFDTSTPMGRAMLGMLGIFAQMERELTAERVVAAMTERASQGKRTANEVLGYDLLGTDSLQINPAESRVVRYIFDQYLKHKCLSAVAEMCNMMGYTGKRGRTFTAYAIEVVLSRPVYAGYNMFKGKVYKGNHQPIVTIAEYNKVQRLLHKNHLGRHSKTQTYLQLPGS